jgi:hypothetical protein
VNLAADSRIECRGHPTHHHSVSSRRERRSGKVPSRTHGTQTSRPSPSAPLSTTSPSFNPNSGGSNTLAPKKPWIRLASPPWGASLSYTQTRIVRPGETTSNVAVWFQMGQSGVPISAGSPVGWSEETGRVVCEAEGRRGGGDGSRTLTDLRLATTAGAADPLFPVDSPLVLRFEPNAAAIARFGPFEASAPALGAVELDDEPALEVVPPTLRTVTSPPAEPDGGRLRRRAPFLPSLDGVASGGGAPHSRETELETV